MRAIFVFLSLILVGPLLAEEPGEFVKRAYAEDRSAYIPQGELAGFFSAELQALFKEARVIDEEFNHRFPDDKPPFADYDVLKPGPDAPRSFRMIPSGADDPTGLCPVVVEFSYDVIGGKTICDYAVIFLSAKDGSWEIVEIAYIGVRPGESIPPLTAALKEGIAGQEK